MHLGHLAAVANGDAVALELGDQVVRHRFRQLGSAVQERHQGAAAGEPDRCLRGRVAAAHDAHALSGADLRLRRTGRVEDAGPLEMVEVGNRQAAVLGAGREHDRVRRDLDAALEAHGVALVAGLEGDRPVGGRRAGAELARLGDRAAGELGAADSRWEAEVVLDPP